MTPSSALAYSTTYTATVSGAKDSAGDPMRRPFSWSFTTDAAAPRSQPSRRQRAPRASPYRRPDGDVQRGGAVEHDHLHARELSAGSTVAATVAYNSSNNTVTLTPSSALAYSTTYTATVSGARIRAGDPMSAPFSWSFTTAAADRRQRRLSGRDTTTQGTGSEPTAAQGYEVIDGSSSLPSYATVNPRARPVLPGPPTRPKRGPAGCGRLRPRRSLLVLGQHFTVNVDLTDGHTQNLELHFVQLGQHRSCRAISDHQRVYGRGPGYRDGRVVQLGRLPRLAVSGNLNFTFTRSAGANAVLSGCSLTRLRGAKDYDSGFAGLGRTERAVSTTATATFNQAMLATTISFTLPQAGAVQ